MNQHITDQDFHNQWSHQANQFTQLLDTGNTTAAWTLLSNAAEDFLATKHTGHRRSQPWRPCQQPLPSKHANNPQSIKLRRLLRLLRTAREGLRTPTPTTIAAIQRKNSSLQHLFPALPHTTTDHHRRRTTDRRPSGARSHAPHPPLDAQHLRQPGKATPVDPQATTTTTTHHPLHAAPHPPPGATPNRGPNLGRYLAHPAPS